jgi:hypothetical protein
MIPGKLERFLEDDRDLVPCGHRIVGWRVGADHQTLACMVPALFLTGLVENLTDNGRFAVTIEEFPTHETYQFKGQYLRHRDAGAEDQRLVARIRERFARSVRSVLTEIPEAVLRDVVLDPAVIVEMRVEEIFLQTPGPGAGTRIVPPAERS